MSLTPFIFFGLRARFMLLAIALTGLFSGIWGSWTWQRESTQLRSGLSREGSLLVSSMTIPIINALLYEELGIIEEGGLLDNFIADIMRNPQLAPVYAMVLDRDGRVLAHNRLTEFGNLYRDPLSRSALAAHNVIETAVEVEGARVLDFAAPLAIGEKRWGCLRVGVPLASLELALTELLQRILGFSLVFALGSLGLFFLVGRRLARPLQTLARHMEEVRETAFDQPPETSRRDEIGQLQRSFAYMLQRLRVAEESRLSAQQRMLENERLATIGMIVSGVAHEVNNPLAGILGALYHVERKGGEEIVRYTQLIGEEVERIRKIVGQLLDLSRSGAVDFERVESRTFFQDLALFARMALRGRLVRFEAKDLCTPLVLQLDRDKIHQVVLNLVINAADVTPENGVIELQAYDFDHWYCLRVTDQGGGVPTELQERIFDPFFSTKEPGRGSGLGLAISRTIAERHAGRLYLDSREETGASFCLKIPQTGAQPQTKGPA